MLSRFKKLWNRYNPKRTYVEMDGYDIIFLAEIGYVELYHGEWFFTDAGLEALKKGIEVKYANIRS